MNKVYRERAIEQAKTGMEPMPPSSPKLGMDKQKTKEILEVRNLAISRMHPGTMMTTVHWSTPSPASILVTQPATQSWILHRFLGEAVDQLEANEQAVVVARWGLHDGPPLSRSEIATAGGQSRMGEAA